MKVLYVTSEAVPFIASGGLGDVAGSLPKAIKNQKTACRVVLPLYAGVSSLFREKMKFLCHFNVPVGWRQQYCGVFQYTLDGVIYYFLDNEYYFKRGNLYGDFDDAERFAFFCRGVLEMLKHINFAPDIIHCNDWQSALVSAYLNFYYRGEALFSNIKTVFTIHNIQYQGQYSFDILEDVFGISSTYHSVFDYNGCVNLMKAAIELSDMVTTVSPTYAEEILDPWFSHKLDPILRQNRHKLVGIINGIDIKRYNPETDPNLNVCYSAASLEKKAQNKTWLKEHFDLEKSGRPLIGMVTRLVSHKGLDLVKFVFDDIIALDFDFVLLGSGEREFEAFFSSMRQKYPGRVGICIGFVPALASQIYSGADFFLMPSSSEPCGLAQMVALRYGTIPIVRETGGLKDTIKDLGGPDGNGFTFKTYNAHDMLGAAARAKNCYDTPDMWEQCRKHAMECDNSWQRSACEYVRIYKQLLGLA